jgi:O-antigen/teichoic acid export membrane protein
MDPHHDFKNKQEAGVFEVHALVLLGAVCGLWMENHNACKRAVRYAEERLKKIDWRMGTKLAQAAFGFVAVMTVGSAVAVAGAAVAIPGFAVVLAVVPRGGKYFWDRLKELQTR